MKRGGILILLLFLVLSLSLVAAAANDTETTKVNKAYSCLQNKVNSSDKCSALSTQEKTFVVLATNQCRSNLLSDSQNSGECWGATSSSGCKVKETAQAMLALRSGTTAAQNWLYSKNATPTELQWYLEIESSNPTSCTIGYGSSSYTVNIGEDKKIDSGAGPCLTLDTSGYWLAVSQTCYNTEFTVSCDQSFLTTTLFTKQNSGTIHVSSETSSASAQGSTKETINSYCLADSGSCTYEGTLWAALALDAAGKDISAYLPYLITLADDNQRLLPNSFLYYLTANDDYKLNLLSEQKNNQYWMESGDKYYDTALALYPLKQDTSQEKANAKTWLLSTQDSNGCWENNVRNTAFILASVWPKTFSGTGGGGTSLPDCESSGKYCASSTECTSSQGSILSEYDCPGTLQKCCSVQPIVKTCADLGGTICSPSERCAGGAEPGASGLRSGEICCARGGECLSTNGTGTGTTPIPPSTTTQKNYTWIFVLTILIVLVLLGILFRNKLRMFWFRIKPGKGKPSAPPRGPPGFPYIQGPMQRIERRILMPQPQYRAPPQRPLPQMKSGAQKELDEVLRKLKEMGK